MQPPKTDEDITDVHKILRRLDAKVDAVIEGQAILDAVEETRREVLAAVNGVVRRLDGDGDGKTGIVARLTALEGKTGIVIAVITSVTALLTALGAIAVAYLK
jgi:hypothetical protein